MFKSRYLIPLFSSLIVFLTFLSCTEDPASSELSDEIKPRGSVTGYIINAWSEPVKDVIVTVDADSATPGLSNSDGMFKVGQVLAGTYTLSFSSNSYDNTDSYSFTILDGEDIELMDTIVLSSSYYRVSGTITKNTIPQTGAGIAIAGTPYSTISGKNGVFTLNKIPMDLDTVKLICAKDTLGYSIAFIADSLLIQDTISDIGDISLDMDGAAVSGTVYDENRVPIPWVRVTAVGGGIYTRTDADGRYSLKNIPAETKELVISARTENSSLRGAITGLKLRAGATSSGIDIYMKKSEDLTNGMFLNTQDIVVIDTQAVIKLSAWPTTDDTTIVQNYYWIIDSADSVSSLPWINYKVKSGTKNLDVSVKAINNKGLLSAKHEFKVEIINSLPIIKRCGVNSNGRLDQLFDSITVNKGEPVYFIAEVSDPVGGIDSSWWHFGNGDYRKTKGTFSDLLKYTFPEAGRFTTFVRAKDLDSQDVFDTVVVNVNNAPFFSNMNLVNTSAAVGHKYKYLLNAIDADSQTITYTMLNTIDGMKLVKDTLTWKPDSSDLGTHVVSIEASDSCGGADTLTWAIKVTYSASTNAYLDSLVPSAGQLSPVFDSLTTTYFVVLPNEEEWFRVKPIPADNSTQIYVNNIPVKTGTYCRDIKLTSGQPDTLDVEVVAQDGIATVNYSVIVTRDFGKNAKLSSLIPSEGRLIPDFNPDITEYIDSVGYDIKYLKVRGSLTDFNAKLTINGVTTASGEPSSIITLNEDPDTATITVTADDDSTTNNYRIIFYHRESNNTRLENLVLSQPGMTPEFNPESLSYSLSVSKSVHSISVKPYLFDDGSVEVNGASVTSGTFSSPIPLLAGINEIPVVVTAPNGIDTASYIVSIDRAPGSSADLTSLTINNDPLDGFLNSTATYTDTVNFEVSAYNILPIAEEPGAIIIIGSDTLQSGVEHSVSLNVGSQIVKIKVISEDGSNSRDFAITVIRYADVSLEAINLTDATALMVPAFHKDSLNYTITVEHESTAVVVVPIATDPSGISAINMNGTAITSGTAYSYTNLQTGPKNTLHIEVSGNDGFSKKTYTAIINRKYSSDVSLTNIRVQPKNQSEYDIDTSFLPTTISYVDTVDTTCGWVMLRPDISDPKAYVTINGSVLSDNVQSGQLPLSFGANEFSLIVTAEDSVTTQTYTVTVYRAPNSNPLLRNLVVSNAVVEPSFDSTGVDSVYKVYVPNEISEVTITPTHYESQAKITLNGTQVASATPSLPQSLTEGDNEFTIVSTAMDGINIKNYSLTIHRRVPDTTYELGLHVQAGEKDTLYKAATPHHFTQSILIDSGASLYIEPGVQLLMDSAVSIDCRGELIAKGTATDSIYFMAYNNNKPWGYILMDSSVASSWDADTNYVSGSVFEYCVIEYGGASNKNATFINDINTTLLVNFCSIRKNTKTGLCSNGLIIINHCKINNNKNDIQQSAGGVRISKDNIICNSIINNNMSTEATSNSAGGIYSINAIIKNCIITNNTNYSWAYGAAGVMAEGGKISNCRIDGNNSSISAGESSAGAGVLFYNAILFSCNLIINNFSTGQVASAVNLQGIDSVYNNTFYNNKSNNDTSGHEVRLCNTFKQIHNNNFVNCNNPRLINYTNHQGSDINMENNYWGTTDTDTIKTLIYDYFDDNSKGVVDFEPFLTEPNPDCPDTNWTPLP